MTDSRRLFTENLIILRRLSKVDMRKIAFVFSVLSVWCSLRAAERLVVVAGSDHEPLAGATVLTRAGIIAGLTDS